MLILSGNGSLHVYPLPLSSALQRPTPRHAQSSGRRLGHPFHWIGNVTGRGLSALIAAVAIGAATAPAPVLGASAPVSSINEVELIATPTGTRPVLRDVLVRFDSGTAARSRSGTRSRVLDAAGADAQHARRVEGLPGAWLVPVDGGASPAAVARMLDARADVTWAVPDAPAVGHVVSNDPLFSNLWGLSNTGQRVEASTPFMGLPGIDISARGAWASTQGSADVSVAVVDSGTVLDHPDLTGNLRTANDRNYVPDATGAVDPASVEDLNLHGTHVAGTIGAIGNNGRGVVGVNWTVGMITVRVLDFASRGTAASLVEGMAHAGSVARIVNVSIGSSGGSLQPVTDAINANPNTLYVVAAGNDASNNDSTPVSPCNVESSNVLCVAAIDARGALASFSNYGAISVDVAAPGVDIQSTVPKFGTAFEPAINRDGGTPTPRPDGWSQTPANQWEWESSDGTGYAKLTATPASGSGVDQWIIQAPGAFTPPGRACRLNASLAVSLNPGSDQSVALAYRTGGGGTWQTVPASVTAGDTGGSFIPWAIDLSMIDGKSGVELRFVVESAKGAGALGTAIMSPVVTCILPQDAAGNYGFSNGTSMAAPQVSGIGALLLSKNPGLSAAQLKEAITSTTVPMASLAGKVVTGGRVNASAALAAVPDPPTPASPVTAANPQLPTTTMPSLTRSLVLRVGRNIPVRRGSARAPVRVKCAETRPSTCAVTVALRMRVARKGAARPRWLALGTRRVTLPPGWKGVVSVPLTRRARSLLGRHPRVRTTVIAAVQKGSPARAPVRRQSRLVRR